MTANPQPAVRVDARVKVPIEPTPELLHSMAVRYDHGLGIPGYYDQPAFGAENVGHAKRLEATIRVMRQLHEEVVGTGFYRAALTPAPTEAGGVSVYRENLLEAWSALRMIREAIETLGPAGALMSEEAVNAFIAPTFSGEAEALIAGIQKIATQPAREAQEPVAWRAVAHPETGMGTMVNQIKHRLTEDADSLYGKENWTLEELVPCHTPPDAAATIERLTAELERHQSDRPYVIGWNDGFEHVHGPLRFPTMLRKMWSGGEVQKWLDEQRIEAARTAVADEGSEIANLRAELASLREKAKADVAAEREACAQVAGRMYRPGIARDRLEENAGIAIAAAIRSRGQI